MNIIDYRYENLKDVNFPFEIRDEVRKIGVDTIVINNMLLHIHNKNLYNYFWYCLKRQHDLKTVSEKNRTVKKDDKYYHIFNGNFNLIGTFTQEEFIGKDFKNFQAKVKRNSDKAFWGNFNNGNILIGGKEKFEVEHFRRPFEGNTTKVLIQPPDKDYDESFIVYINDEYRRPGLMKNLEVLYIFETIGNITLHSVIADHWIY